MLLTYYTDDENAAAAAPAAGDDLYVTHIVLVLFWNKFKHLFNKV